MDGSQDDLTPDLPAYADSVTYWRRYQPFFPAPLRCHDGATPAEEWWGWRGMRVHLDRIAIPEAPVKFLLLHGAGGYGRMLAPYARLCAIAGMEAIAPDLPGYGLTVTNGNWIDYRSWVDCVCDLITEERRRDDRPIVLLGASMGGMLAYSAAGRTTVKAVAATCLLDPRRRDVRRGVALFPALGALVSPILNALPRWADSLRVPIKWLVNMEAMSNHPDLNGLVKADPLGGGNRVHLGFLRTYLASAPSVEPEHFTTCPVLWTQPAADRWTPPELSRPFFEQLSGDKKFVTLADGGHMPVEASALADLDAAVRQLLDQTLNSQER